MQKAVTKNGNEVKGVKKDAPFLAPFMLFEFDSGPNYSIQHIISQESPEQAKAARGNPYFRPCLGHQVTSAEMDCESRIISNESQIILTEPVLCISSQ